MRSLKVSRRVDEAPTRRGSAEGGAIEARTRRWKRSKEGLREGKGKGKTAKKKFLPQSVLLQRCSAGRCAAWRVIWQCRGSRVRGRAMSPKERGVSHLNPSAVSGDFFLGGGSQEAFMMGPSW